MNEMFMSHVWIISASTLTALSCALLGTFLVLRKMSLVGDAISHSILPGLAAAFLISGSRGVIPMFIGASICGLLTALLSQFLSTQCRVDRGASLGVVFTSLFALGIVLIRRAADRVDLDPGCVLYGLLEFVPLDTIMLFGFEVPRAVAILSATFIANVIVVSLFYKELIITSFDPLFSTTNGIRANLVHYTLMAFVTFTAVAAFESVGSILVVAMFIIPGATARLLANTLAGTLTLSLVVAVASSLGGYQSALYWNTSVAGAISVVAGLLFITVAVCAPQHGILSDLLQQSLTRLRILGEDIIGLIYRCENDEIYQKFTLSARNICAAQRSYFAGHFALWMLQFRGHIRRRVDSTFELTDAGRAIGRDVVRTHRLWEIYLVEALGLHPDHVHDTAERLEHYTTASLQAALSEKTHGTTTDPHGRKVPRD